MINEKIQNFLNAPEDSISLGDISKIRMNEKVNILWGDEKIGILKKGSKVSSPIAEALNSEFISSENKLLISAKLQNWIDNQITYILNPIKDKLDEKINSNIRAIAFNCFENLGTLKIDDYIEFIKKIENENKHQLSKLGIRIGAKYFFMPNLLKKKSLELNAILWLVFNEFDSNDFIPLPSNGRVSFVSSIKMPETYWQSIGYICLNKFAFRVDVFEKIFYLARKKIKYGPFLETHELMNPIGCNSDQLEEILSLCGYQVINLFNDKKLYFFKQKKKIIKKSIKKSIKKPNIKSLSNKNKKLQKKLDPNSPFAVLEKLL